MKIKIYNQSGKPSDMDSAINYEKDFKAEYDKLWKMYKVDGKISIEEFKLKLDKFESDLRQKYPMHKEIKMPSSGKQWKELIMSVEAPVTLAITEEKKELALFIMDAQY